MTKAVDPHLQAAMAKAYGEGLGADFTLLCERQFLEVKNQLVD